MCFSWIISIPNKISLVNIYFSNYPYNILGQKWQPVLMKNYISVVLETTTTACLLLTHIQLFTKKALQFLLHSLNTNSA